MSGISILLTQIDQAYDRRSWHGTNLRGSIRGLTADAVAWRPAPGRHNIQEIAVHAAFWKYVVWRRLTRQPRGSFPLEGSNWFARPAPDAVRWRADVRLLADMHRQLRDAVSAASERLLRQPIRGGRDTPLSLVFGIIAHDVYHAGQIQLIKRLGGMGAGRSSRS
jgi:uncharacterized damage-inducible protein DinB